MASGNSEAIRQLSVELMKAATLLDKPEALETGSVTSDISKQFVGGTGLLDLGSKGKAPSVSASNDQEGSSHQGGSDDEYEQQSGDDSSDDEDYDDDDEYDDTVILEWLNREETKASIVSTNFGQRPIWLY